MPGDEDAYEADHPRLVSHAEFVLRPLPPVADVVAGGSDEAVLGMGCGHSLHCCEPVRRPEQGVVVEQHHIPGNRPDADVDVAGEHERLLPHLPIDRLVLRQEEPGRSVEVVNDDHSGRLTSPADRPDARAEVRIRFARNDDREETHIAVHEEPILRGLVLPL